MSKKEKVKKVSTNVEMASRLHSILADWIDYAYADGWKHKTLCKIDEEGHAWLNQHGRCK